MKGHQLTKEEVEKELLKHIWIMVEYWRDLPNKTIEDRLSGLAFSILAALDGESAALPAFIVSPKPCPEDKKYLKSRGKNWYPKYCDIAGSLHNKLHGIRRVK